MIVRQSRFIAHAAPVTGQADTLDFFNQVADRSATHNCWAWKIDHTWRFNDDGEPASTAGRPILAAIESKKLDRVMVVVTRHFGGILLGVGGLIRAYSGAAARCIDQGTIREVHPASLCVVEAGFAWTGPVHAAVEACEAVKKAEEFTASGICLTLEVRDDRRRQLENLLRDSTRGEVQLRRP